MTENKAVLDWVEQVSKLTKPDKIYWCDGSDNEYNRMIKEMVDRGEFIALNSAKWP